MPVVFDFDNTIISGDIGEAVLALLARSGRLQPKSICETLSPDLHLTRNSKLRLRACGSIMEYYEAMLSPTIHGKADSTPLANGYVWATQVMEKLLIRWTGSPVAPAWYMVAAVAAGLVGALLIREPERSV